MHAITAMQLTGQAPAGMQLPKADIGGVFNMGGAAVANYVSILEQLRSIPTSNLAHLLLQTARRFPDRPALIWRERTWTWDELSTRVQTAAGALAARGVRHGDRVLLHARNSNAVLETMFASWVLGAVWVPTNFRLTPPEVAYLAASSGAAVHIFDAAFPDHAAAAKAENPACQLEISIGPGTLEWDALATQGAPVTRAADVATRSSGVVLLHLRHHRAAEGRRADARPDGIRRLQPSVRPDAGTTENDVSLVVAPLSHGAGVHALPQVARGAATVLLSGERLDCEEAWRLVERHRVTNMFTVPTILTMLDPARRGRSLRPFQSALRDLCRLADVPRRPEVRPGASSGRCWCSISAWAR